MTSESETAAHKVRPYWLCLHNSWMRKRPEVSLYCWSVTLANQARLRPFCWPQRCNTSLCFSTGTGNLRYFVHGLIYVCVCVCLRLWGWKEVMQGRKSRSRRGRRWKVRGLSPSCYSYSSGIRERQKMIFRDSWSLSWCSPAWRGVFQRETLHGCTGTLSNQCDEVDGPPRLHTCRHSHPHEQT